jgi:lipopolysaccharide/colanic/teichoic acid biosynthesis glycosyltransferase
LTRNFSRDSGAKRLLDVVIAGVLLALLAPVIVLVAAWIRLDSPGSAFFRCRRVGFGGREFGMLKVRKMHDGASGSALTAPTDDRFTPVGRLLARTKLDELPQLWNVLRGEMSLVGPRPEDPSFVALEREAYERILRVRPGITGLSQLAFTRESEILDPVDRDGDYVRRVLPQKMRLDQLYAAQRSHAMDARILLWTVAAVLLRRSVAVNRATGRLTLRRPRQLEPRLREAEGIS